MRALLHKGAICAQAHERLAQESDVLECEVHTHEKLAQDCDVLDALLTTAKSMPRIPIDGGPAAQSRRGLVGHAVLFGHLKAACATRVLKGSAATALLRTKVAIQQELPPVRC